jgi:TPR repeat protein
MNDLRKIIVRLGCAAAIALVALPGAAWADMKSGIAAYKAGDYKTAHGAFAEEAAKGNSMAQFNLAVLYLTGRGVERDISKAVDWHLKAAAQGLPAAEHGLGVIYYQGLAVDKDYAQALKWFRRAAARGFAESEFNIGVMYFNRQGVKRDDIEVVKWVTLAAARKFAPAEHRLGQMYENGVIFIKDLQSALHWYGLAAGHGHKTAAADRSRVAKALNLPDRPAPEKTAGPKTSRPTAKMAAKPVSQPKTAQNPPAQFAVTLPGQKIRRHKLPNSVKSAGLSEIRVPRPDQAPKIVENTEKPGLPGRREWRVQFASFRTTAETDRAWQMLMRRAPGAIGDTPRIVMQADLGDRGVYQRLQAGPLGGREAAIALCRSIHEILPNQGCLPIRVRVR